jgi:hypothetical protein
MLASDESKPLWKAGLFAKGKLAIPDPGNKKGVAAAKKGNAGLNSLGVTLRTTLAAFSNGLRISFGTNLSKNPIVSFYIVNVKASTQHL